MLNESTSSCRSFIEIIPRHLSHGNSWVSNPSPRNVQHPSPAIPPQASFLGLRQAGPSLRAADLFPHSPPEVAEPLARSPLHSLSITSMPLDRPDHVAQNTTSQDRKRLAQCNYRKDDLNQQKRVCVHAVFLRHDRHRHRDYHNLILRSSII